MLLPPFCTTLSFTAVLKRSIALLAAPRDTSRRACLTTTSTATQVHRPKPGTSVYRSSALHLECLYMSRFLTILMPLTQLTVNPTKTISKTSPQSLVGYSVSSMHVPQFDIEKLRPFEAVFADNKDSEHTVRGGTSTALVFIDYKTRTKHKIDLYTKMNNGLTFRKIVAREGIHKLPYNCRVYSDGCGSMNYVASMVSMLGVDHQFSLHISNHSMKQRRSPTLHGLMHAQLRFTTRLLMHGSHS